MNQNLLLPPNNFRLSDTNHKITVGFRKLLENK